MNRIRVVAAQLKNLLRRSKQEDEIARELDAHIALGIADNVRRGMSHADARRDVLVRLGGRAATQELCREQARIASIEHLWRELRHSVAALVHAPSFTTTVVVSLGLSIGAIATVFGVADGVLYRPLSGVVAADRLFAVYGDDPRTAAFDYQGVSFPEFTALSEMSGAHRGLAAYLRFPLFLGRAQGSQRLIADFVSGTYFKVLGTSPVIGRLLDPADDRSAETPVVISSRLWRDEFARQPDVIGRAMVLSGMPVRIVGVTPEDFRGILLDWYGDSSIDVFMPLSAFDRVAGRPVLASRGFVSLMTVGRLADQESVTAANAAFAAVAPPEENGDASGPRRLIALPAGRARFFPGRWEATTAFLALLFASAAALLLIACANIANLLLARAVARRHELSIRWALGASRGRIAGQELMTAVLWASAAAGLGAVIAQILLNQLAAYPEPFRVPLFQPLRLEYRTMLFVAALAGSVAAALGLVSTMWALRWTAATGSRVTNAAGRRWAVRKILLAAQITISFVVLSGTAVLIVSAVRLLTVPRGFVTDDIVLASLDAGGSKSHADAGQVLRQLETALRSEPGISFVALGDPPLGTLRTTVRLSTSDGRVDKVSTLYRPASAGYLTTLGIQLLRGREFIDDTADATGSVVVNDVLAERYWPGRDPIGESLTLEGESQPREVVGVARAVPYNDLSESPQPYIYLPLFRRAVTAATIVLRGAEARRGLEPRLRDAVAKVSRDIAVVKVETMSEHVAANASRARLAASALAVMSAIALVIMVVGVFGLASFVARQRYREVAIRLALGARRQTIVTGALLETALVACGGICVGGLLWVKVSPFVQDEAHAISARDPRVLAMAALVVLALSLVAAYLPARRVSRENVQSVLRAD